ncbi:hypothetical protein ABIA32_002679 [Streptacidiphilus sp. MAP12-20]|uniref:hypothetical protein n=1 Tax=Streptacidiphilus sp. MAP12-20 TaxID=3156299 RepID=UPI0035120384
MTTPATPSCDRTGCTAGAVVHWSRRPTAEELAATPAEQQTSDMRRLVHACGPHAIGLDLAAHVHSSTCAGPNAGTLPQCGCTPEPLTPTQLPTLATLTTGWQITP